MATSVVRGGPSNAGTRVTPGDLDNLAIELKMALRNRMDTTMREACLEIDMNVGMALRMLPVEYRLMTLDKVLSVGLLESVEADVVPASGSNDSSQAIASHVTTMVGGP
eukprot:TRINITY_DN24152_c0_g1_i1.p3 TRINITY_DN24152_c0_g1~~TRINITY_DN24152_c0_g1_i1.p3  ORF type:complete len:109 (-),score=24.35 TRINITY_DN24152_c0_g1_i1:84-410(-)